MRLLLFFALIALAAAHHGGGRRHGFQRCAKMHPRPPGPPLKPLFKHWKMLPEKCRNTITAFLKTVHDDIIGNAGCTFDDGKKMLEYGIKKGKQGMKELHDAIGFDVETGMKVMHKLGMCPADMADRAKADKYFAAVAEELGTTSEALWEKLSSGWNNNVRDKLSLSQTCTLKAFVDAHHKMYENRDKVKELAIKTFKEGDSGCPLPPRGHGGPRKRMMMSDREVMEESMMIGRGFEDEDEFDFDFETREVVGSPYLEF